MWQRENDVEVRRWQKLAQPILHPLFSFQAATIWAMPITTTMILVVLVLAVITTINMHSQTNCVTIRQFFQHSLTVWIELFYAWMTEYFAL